MKNRKIIIIWFIAQVLFIFTACFFLVNGRSDIASDMFLIFMIQSSVFAVYLLYSFRSWFTHSKSK